MDQPESQPGRPRLPDVDAAGTPQRRRVPVGALVASIALLGSVGLLALALAGLPPFRAALAPAATPTMAPSSTAAPSPSSAASPSPLGPAQIDALVARIEQRVTQIRQLDARAPVAPHLVTTAEATRLLIADFQRHNPATYLVDEAQLYRALGLLGPSDDLGAIYERFLATQVLGFYRPEDTSLYVVSDQAFGPLQELTTAHEYTHALQDQNFGLRAIIPERLDQGDLDHARDALAEGDATLSMTEWAVAELTPDQLSGLLAAMQDPAARQALAELPPIVRETSEFPYSAGLAFVQQAWAQGGWAGVDAIWRRPPASAEQILHPAKYAAGEQPLQVALTERLADRLGMGWRLALQDTAGELGVRIWLETAVAPATAEAAAAGWGGDRVGLLRGPGGAWAVVWLTTWDTGTDAHEFAAGAQAVAARLGSAAVFGPGQPGVGSRDVAVLVASNDGVAARVIALLGLGPD